MSYDDPSMKNGFLMEQAQPLQSRYTYADLLRWDDDHRYELIDGELYRMTSPTLAHQEILGELFLQFAAFLKGKPCKVLVAPFDVRLNAEGKDDTVLQPDILVVCDTTKFDVRSCVGAPDLVVEILSPSTSGRDQLLKFHKYLQAGVREYWIVDPDSKTVAVYILENGKYVCNAYGSEDTIPVHVLEGCHIVMRDVLETSL